MLRPQTQWNQNGNWVLTASRDQTCKVRCLPRCAPAALAGEPAVRLLSFCVQVASLTQAKLGPRPFPPHPPPAFHLPIPPQLYDVRMQRELMSFRGHNRDVTYACWHPFHEELFVSGAGCRWFMFGRRAALFDGTGHEQLFVPGAGRLQLRKLPHPAPLNMVPVWWFCMQLPCMASLTREPRHGRKLPALDPASPCCRRPRRLDDLLAGQPPGATGGRCSPASRGGWWAAAASACLVLMHGITRQVCADRHAHACCTLPPAPRLMPCPASASHSCHRRRCGVRTRRACGRPPGTRQATCWQLEQPTML